MAEIKKFQINNTIYNIDGMPQFVNRKTNSSPTSSFSAQTWSIGYTNEDVDDSAGSTLRGDTEWFIIKFRASTSSSVYFYCIGQVGTSILSFYNAPSYSYNRGVSITKTSTQFQFSFLNCYRVGSTSTQNGYLIPVAVYNMARLGLDNQIHKISIDGNEQEFNCLHNPKLIWTNPDPTTALDIGSKIIATSSGILDWVPKYILLKSKFATSSSNLQYVFNICPINNNTRTIASFQTGSGTGYIYSRRISFSYDETLGWLYMDVGNCSRYQNLSQYYNGYLNPNEVYMFY